ncbi:hypothetical protein D3P09_14220 [Paenibacillus pinisoli]|uniref:Uncharacterized protein n=1 Tax=Paenibacillus pinisoli TaxID=1276110 RepID=A0A3A6PDB2_9BACL|nr:hypothetical protein [Paenibacillus pinisoli]RJX38697.1 hypothetical protein D3P09_14220 [Paenibacillus pinisoli]
MRNFAFVISIILTVAGAIHTFLSIMFTFIIMSEVSTQPSPVSASIVFLLILFIMFYLPTFAFYYFGHRIRKKLKLTATNVAAEYNPGYSVPPVQQRVETRTVFHAAEPKPAPAPRKAPSVSVECKGCGSRKAVAAGESTSCDYCGSPLTANA